MGACFLPHRRRQALFLLLILSSVLVITLSTLYLRNVQAPVPVAKKSRYNGNKNPIKIKGYVVDTPGCKIPDIDESYYALDPSLKFNGCDKTDLTVQRGDTLYIDRDVAKNVYGVTGEVECCYNAFTRIEGDDNRGLRYDSNKKCFTDKVKIEDEFIKVFCLSKRYHNYHAFILDKSATVDKRKVETKPDTVEKLNVAMIGIDSVSRLNSRRQLKQLRSLLSKLGGIEMVAYSKVASNTWVNVVPMLTGKHAYANETEHFRKDPSYAKMHMDDMEVIWKNFSKEGYATLHAEDDPTISIFNYLALGFNKQPTDHYNRPLALAFEKDTAIWQKHFQTLCFGGRMETKINLDYTRDFHKVYKDKSRFSFTFITRLTHGHPSGLQFGDTSHAGFVADMAKDKLLDNTVLFYYGDHGFRGGGVGEDIRYTWAGQLEELLPLMVIVFPRWFYEKYPEITKNLKTNAHRLTTPFDVYETLKDILHFKGEAGYGNLSSRGISLMKEIPPERTCRDAGVQDAFCACGRGTSNVDKTSTNVIAATNASIAKINFLTSPHRQICAKYSLGELLTARKIDVFGINATDYLVSFAVKPGGGRYEMFVRHIDEHFVVREGISRINLYGNTSHCVDTRILKPLCFCI